MLDGSPFLWTGECRFASPPTLATWKSGGGMSKALPNSGSAIPIDIRSLLHSNLNVETPEDSQGRDVLGFG
jgi:hypothetical protein